MLSTSTSPGSHILLAERNLNYTKLSEMTGISVNAGSSPNNGATRSGSSPTRGAFHSLTA